MIDEIIVLLKDKLNGYFKLKTTVSEDVVNFIDGSKFDPVSFPVNNVSPLLINIEEDKTLRQADRFEGKMRNGIKTQVNPTLCINLLVLFVCNFSEYRQSLKFLSLIMKFFQRNQVVDHYNTPELDQEVDKLKIELVTLPLSQQNEIWNSLRTSYVPSVLYKISMLVFHDEESIEVAREINEIRTNVISI